MLTRQSPSSNIEVIVEAAAMGAGIHHYDRYMGKMENHITW
jgi:hypothetical protein